MLAWFTCPALPCSLPLSAFLLHSEGRQAFADGYRRGYSKAKAKYTHGENSGDDSDPPTAAEKAGREHADEVLSVNKLEPAYLQQLLDDARARQEGYVRGEGKLFPPSFSLLTTGARSAKMNEAATC